MPLLPDISTVAQTTHLNVRDLGCEREGKWLFRNMTWSVPRGSFVAITGPSGSGKTSLLRILSALENPAEGAISYSCQEGCQHEPDLFQKRMGIIFQNFRLSPTSTLLDNVLTGRLARYPWWRSTFGFPPSDKQEALELLETLGLAHRTNHWAAEVSGGEQQRTSVARAFFQQPEIILADEPVSQLDPELAVRVLDQLRSFTTSGAASVLCVLHDPTWINLYADYLLKIDPRSPDHGCLLRVEA